MSDDSWMTLFWTHLALAVVQTFMVLLNYPAHVRLFGRHHHEHHEEAKWWGTVAGRAWLAFVVACVCLHAWGVFWKEEEEEAVFCVRRCEGCVESCGYPIAWK